MKRAILAWFILANLFCFVTTFADLKLPWLPVDSVPAQQERITEAGILTQSALGGAAGSYVGLLLTKRMELPANEYLRVSLLILMGQNAIAYCLALALFRRRPSNVTEHKIETPAGDTADLNRETWNGASA